MEKQKKKIEELLGAGKWVQLYPQGYSMYPMFVPGRDEAVISAVNPEDLRRGDVVLYRRDNGMLVLHRLYRRAADGFYMVGDNQSVVEGPLRADQIKGVLAAFIRKGRHVDVKNPIYRTAAGLWLFMCPVRRPVLAACATVKRVLLRLCKNA